METDTYIVRCWNCRNDFDATEAVWCSCDPKRPSKVCPFCLQCFCPAEEDYKQAFWQKAPSRLTDELALLQRSRDRLGDILIRNQKITTPQLLQALVAQKQTGGLLGRILVEKGWVTPADIDEALRHQGYRALAVSQAPEVTPSPLLPSTPPQEALSQLLTLGAKKGASDIHIEPTQDELAVKLRIDGYFYKVKPLPRTLLKPLLEQVNSLFHLDPAGEGLSQKGKASSRLLDREYDLRIETSPTRMGRGVTIKLIDRRYFLKNFTALGLAAPDQLFLVRALEQSSGLVLVTSPPYNGALTTCYSIMDHVAKSERKVVSVEPAIQWEAPYVEQIEVSSDKGLDFPSALRSAAGTKPDVVFALGLPEKETATLVCELATSMVVIVTFPALSAADSVWRFYELGVPAPVLARGLSLALNQRLVRRVCTNCREGPKPAKPEQLAVHGIGPDEARSLKIYRGTGCPACNGIGYRRRKGIFEVMTLDRQLREVLVRNPSVEDIERAAIRAGMETLRERCLRDVRDGVTSIEEFIRWRL